ncbi:hypothetical protein I4U23_000021 [Adineta vaga]|nr:hypothetical protein I4U23_000021 [Adineta vaga]
MLLKISGLQPFPFLSYCSLTKLSQSEWISIVNSLAFLPKLRLLLSVSDLSSYNFLLNYTQTIAVSPHRILLRQWLNQNLVLQHSRVKFFVNHGGINSIGEGVYACKPMLVMPGFADQQANAAKALELQIGLILHRDKLSSETLVEKLKELIAKEELMKEKLFKLHQISELEGGAKMTAKLINHWLLIGYKHVDTTENYLSVTQSHVRNVAEFTESDTEIPRKRIVGTFLG